MSQKFSFIIEVDEKGNPKGKAFKREDALTAITEFNKLRDAGVESYLFQMPQADKKSKSQLQRTATTDAGKQPEAEVVAEPSAEATSTDESKSKKKRNSLLGF